MQSGRNHLRAAAALLLLAGAVPLSGCGAGGMARAVTTAGQGFDRGECLSRQFRTGEDCDQEAISQGD